MSDGACALADLQVSANQLKRDWKSKDVSDRFKCRHIPMLSPLGKQDNISAKLHKESPEK